MINRLIRRRRKWPRSLPEFSRCLGFPWPRLGNEPTTLSGKGPRPLPTGRAPAAVKHCGEAGSNNRRLTPRPLATVFMIYDVNIDGKNYRLEIERAEGRWSCRLDGREVEIDAVLARPDVLSLRIGNQAYEI